jgi:CubicO group peptidase (beta-lactamase class C family)
MKKINLIAGRFALVLLVFFLASCHEARHKPLNKYEQYLSEASARGEFNGVALVFDDGDVVYQGAFGIRTIDPPSSLDVNSQFRLASVSKQFTAMAVMQLMEDGKLRYDQDIRDFIPELPYEGITIRHLLHHVSGLPDYEPLMDQHWKPELKVDDPARYTDGNADVIKMLVAKNMPVYFKPGEKWRYSNTGYNLLGSIVARASGVSFAEFLRTRVFDPAGMSSTVMYDYVVGPDPHMPNRAFGYQVEWNGTDLSPADSHYLNPGQGEDGVYSTIGDMLKWDRALYTEKLVSEATLQEAFTPAVLNNGKTTGLRLRLVHPTITGWQASGSALRWLARFQHSHAPGHRRGQVPRGADEQRAGTIRGHRRGPDESTLRSPSDIAAALHPPRDRKGSGRIRCCLRRYAVRALQGAPVR